MALPDFPTVTDTATVAIAARHGLGTRAFVPMPQIGIFNVVYAVGDDLILRIPRDAPLFVAAIRNESIAVPLARAAGVRTPRLVVFDDAADILPVPYAIYERVAGENLERAATDPALVTPVWRELGRELALLHTGIEERPPATGLSVRDDKTDPRPLPDVIATAGYFTAVEARWLSAWLDRIAAVIEGHGRRVFLHGDSQATNLIVTPGSLEFIAVLDWGGCLWGDAALDFAGVPLRAVPAMLQGYRERLGADDTTMEARILWRHLQIALHQLRGTPKPTWSWGERPIGMLLEVLRFFSGTPGGGWRGLGPGV